MFCHNCGNEIRQGLNYCNRCGMRVFTEIEKVSSKGDELSLTMTIVTGAVSLAGVIALAVLINRLIRQGGEVPPSAVFLIVVFGLIVTGIVFALSRQISKVHSQAAPILQKSMSKANSTPLLENKTSELDYVPASVSSVTENTTKLFEAVPIKRD